MRLRTRLLILALGLTVAVALLGVSTAAYTGADAGDATHVGTIDLTLEDEHVHVSDVELSGDGLPVTHVDDGTYEIESATVTTEGVTVTYGGTTYQVGQVTIGVENVGVTLEDVTISGE